MAEKRRRMSRTNRTGRTAGEARHVRLYHWMLNCTAWRSLSLPARCLLVEVWARYNGQNNGEIGFSVREAAKALGVGKNTAHQAFRELEGKGFLKARQRGSFHWKAKLATTWQLTAEPCDDLPASKEFMSWRPEIQNTVPVRGTNGPSEGDRGTWTKGQKHPHSPSERDHKRV